MGAVRAHLGDLMKMLCLEVCASWRKIWNLGITLPLAFLGIAAQADSVKTERLGPSAAEQFQPDYLGKKVRNLDVAFNWIADSDDFWFKRQNTAGDELVIFSAATGRQSAAFEFTAFQSALRAARSGTDVTDLRISEVSYDGHSSQATVDTAQGRFLCDMPAIRCAVTTPGFDAASVPAPDRQSIVFRRADNLWLRELASGGEKQLTSDGEPGFGYGDIDSWEDIEKVERRRNDRPDPLNGVVWSPNGRYIVALRQDLRAFPERPLVIEYVPPDHAEPIIHSRKIGTARDAKRPDSELVVIDTATWAVRKASLDPQALNDWALGYFRAGIQWWGADGRSLYFITANRGGTKFGLASIDLATGQAREILSESAPVVMRLNTVDYNRPNVSVLSDGREALWYSERSGYGHLYLYDVETGKVKRQLTRGDWVVFDLLHVDEAKRVAYFTAGPQRDGNPYYRYLYRVSLDGGRPQLLTPEIADHDFKNSFGPFGSATRSAPGSKISPSGRFFVDSYSSTSEPPKVIIRKASGELVGDVLASDISALVATGWRPPERVTVKAADGVTDLYGVLVRSREFDASRRYPLIDYMYPGPQIRIGPTTFAESISGPFDRAQTLADSGFLVLIIDGRGTASRSREFRDAFLRTEDAFGAADHVAAIKGLAAERPYIDLTRVGVMGHSYGGYGSLRAMLLFPKFFKVGVSTVGPGEWFTVTHPVSVERVFGVPGDSAQAREYYDIASNTRLAPRLEGHVLLMYGGIDENVPLTDAFIVFDAFIKADKDIDMLVFPNAPHAVFGQPYAVRRAVEYFVEHLAGTNAR